MKKIRAMALAMSPADRAQMLIEVRRLKEQLGAEDAT
jgi:hypothetical protein